MKKVTGIIGIIGGIAYYIFERTTLDKGTISEEEKFVTVLIIIIILEIVAGLLVGSCLNWLDQREKKGSETQALDKETQALDKETQEVIIYIEATGVEKIKESLKVYIGANKTKGSKSEKDSSIKPKNKKSLKNYINFSSAIGFFERLLYTFCFLTANAQLFAGIIAIKTFMRFPEIKKGASSEITAEKYILGTLLNITFALIGVFFIIVAYHDFISQNELITFLWKIFNNSSS